MNWTLSTLEWTVRVTSDYEESLTASCELHLGAISRCFIESKDGGHHGRFGGLIPPTGILRFAVERESMIEIAIAPVRVRRDCDRMQCRDAWTMSGDYRVEMEESDGPAGP